jgi:hypothetical protein
MNITGFGYKHFGMLDRLLWTQFGKLEAPLEMNKPEYEHSQIGGRLSLQHKPPSRLLWAPLVSNRCVNSS